MGGGGGAVLSRQGRSLAVRSGCAAGVHSGGFSRSGDICTILSICPLGFRSNPNAPPPRHPSNPNHRASCATWSLGFTHSTHSTPPSPKHGHSAATFQWSSSELACVDIPPLSPSLPSPTFHLAAKSGQPQHRDHPGQCRRCPRVR
jgi:hypothetical protein